jgi:hypothetical protein
VNLISQDTFVDSGAPIALTSHVGPGSLTWAGAGAPSIPVSGYLTNGAGGANQVFSSIAFPGNVGCVQFDAECITADGSIIGPMIGEHFSGDFWFKCTDGGGSAGSITLEGDSYSLTSPTTVAWTPHASQTYRFKHQMVQSSPGSQSIIGQVSLGDLGSPLTVTASGTQTLSGPQTGGLFLATSAATLTSGWRITNYQTSLPLTVSPATASGQDLGSLLAITPTQFLPGATLTASLSGAGSISTTTPTSGTPFNYTWPTSGTGTATVTVTDSATGQSATCVISYSPPSAITGGPSSVGVATSSITPLTASSSGGNGTNTYQWQNCSTPDGTFVGIGGATSQTYNAPTPSPGSAPVYYYCNVTSNSITVQSYGYVAGANFTGSTLQPIAVVPVNSPVVALLISDSRGTPGTYKFDETTLTTLLQRAYFPSAITLDNQSGAGTTSQGWASSITASVLGTIPPAIYHALVDLGVNDAKSSGANGGETTLLSVASWKVNIASICAQLLASDKFLAGSTVTLMGVTYIVQPTQFNEFSDASLPLILGYNNAIPSLCNGTTILAGSTNQQLYTTAQNQLYLMDGLHEDDAFGTILATQYAFGLAGANHFKAPVASVVQSGTTYGFENAFTGTLASGGGVYPSQADVRAATVYGPTSNETGTLHVPTAAQVLNGIAVDATTGTVTLPTAAQVLASITFGPASDLTGTVVLPTAAEVESGITFGPGSDLTGTYAGGGGGASAESLTGTVVSATTTSVTFSATGATVFNTTANAYANGNVPRYLSFTSGANKALVTTVTSSSVASGNLTVGFALTTGIITATAGDSVQVD